MADGDFAGKGPDRGGSAERWFIARDGQPHGPVNWNDLLELLRAGQVTAADYVWREGLENWVPLGLLVPAANEPAAAPPMPPCPPPALEPPPVLKPPPALTSGPVPTVGAARATTSAGHRSHRSAGHGRLVAAIIAVAILVAGVVGWSLNSLARKERQTAAVDKAGSSAPAEARRDAPNRSDHWDEPLRGAHSPDSHVEEMRSPGHSHEATKLAPSISAPAVDKPDADTKSPKANDPSAAPAGPLDPPRNGAATDPPSKSATPPSPTDVKPPEDPKPPAVKQPPTEPTKPASRRTLYQEVLISRRPAFNVSGVTIAQDLQYRVISKLVVSPRASDGTVEVSQTIYETKLEKSDKLSQATFEESLRALRGQEIRYTLGKDNEIVKFTGAKDNRKVVKPDGLGGEAFLLSSVMDDDGWKELAQLTFFMPPSTLKRGERFERKLTHNWGALGSWYGTTTYTPAGERSGEQRIDYAHSLYYKPPTKKDAAALPFEVTGTSFKIEQASGSIQWDRKAGRITGASERFVVRGAVATTVLGQSVETQIEESQTFALRVTDSLPSSTRPADR